MVEMSQHKDFGSFNLSNEGFGTAVVEVIAGREFVTLQRQLRHEDVHRSINISIFQMYEERDVFPESIES
jgi:hypothetical protein